MKNLIFKRVVLLSDIQKSANQFVFQNGYNLITAKDNSAGKTSLIKSMLWALGCMPLDVPDSWKALDCKVLVDCSIGEQRYSFYRYNDTIKVSVNGGEYKKFSKVTGEYAELFASIVNFKALLPKRVAVGEDPELVTPPPAYYFLPFYIDQKKGWSEAWEGFADLKQFANWRRTIINFHAGYLSPEHFDLEEEVYAHKAIAAIAEGEVERIDAALAVVDEYIPKTALTINEAELDKITDEIRGKLKSLAEEQELVLDGLSKYTSEKYHINKQLILLDQAISEHEKDYIFSIENVKGDDLECPLCGTYHDNSILRKAEILADKNVLAKQAKAIRKDLSTIEAEVLDASSRLDKIREEIKVINEKYSVRDLDGQQVALSDIIDSLASKAVQKSVSKTKDSKSLQASDANDEQKRLKRAQGKLLSKDEKNKRDEYFRSQLETHINSLLAHGINLSGIKKPTDEKKLFNDGGAAECTRAVLAYHTTIIDMIRLFGTEVLAPFIIDTPKQQEQNDLNYETTIQFILNNISSGQQVFICGQDDPLVKPFKDKAKVVNLNATDKLLDVAQYDSIRREVDRAIRA